jgi:hypothetical protein
MRRRALEWLLSRVPAAKALERVHVFDVRTGGVGAVRSARTQAIRFGPSLGIAPIQGKVTTLC